MRYSDGGRVTDRESNRQEGDGERRWWVGGKRIERQREGRKRVYEFVEVRCVCVSVCVHGMCVCRLGVCKEFHFVRIPYHIPSLCRIKTCFRVSDTTDCDSHISRKSISHSASGLS